MKTNTRRLLLLAPRCLSAYRRAWSAALAVPEALEPSTFLSSFHQTKHRLRRPTRLDFRCVNPRLQMVIPLLLGLFLPSLAWTAEVNHTPALEGELRQDAKALPGQNSTLRPEQQNTVRPDFLNIQRQRAAQRERYRLAMIDARQGKASDARAAFVELEGYPLVPYLEYEILLNRARSSDKDVLAFIARYEALPIAPFLRRQFSLYRMNQRDPSGFLKFYRPGEGDSEMQCYHARALWLQDEVEAAMAATQALWLTGESQHSTCDVSFANWRKRDGLTPELAWQRFELALSAGERRLADYLVRFLDAPHKALANRMKSWLRSPGQHSIMHAFDLTDPSQRRLGVLILKRLIRIDPEKASTALRHYERTGTIVAEDLRELQFQLAKTVTVDEHDWALLDALPEAVRHTPDILEMSIRRAIRESSWPLAAALIAQLDNETAKRPVWRYWKARLSLARITEDNILAERTEDASALFEAAAKALSELAQEREYYGYLAAYLLDLPLQLNDVPIARDQNSVLNLRAAPAAQRIEELLALDQITDARREWFTLTRGFSATELLVAAQLADDWQWPDIAIATVAQAKQWDDLSIRFPQHFRYQIARAARTEGLPESTLFGIARRESGFWPEATSSVGAKGLMQVMPATAQHVLEAAEERLALSDPFELIDPDINIKLGAAYFSELMNDHSQNRILSLAAYNAGPSRVARWDDPEQSLDAWVESIPFAETRAYVQTILMYSYVYARQINEPAEFLYPSELGYFNAILPGDVIAKLRQWAQHSQP